LRLLVLVAFRKERNFTQEQRSTEELKRRRDAGLLAGRQKEEKKESERQTTKLKKCAPITSQGLDELATLDR